MELNVCIWDLARKENDDNIMIVDIEISDSDTIMETMLVELDMNYMGIDWDGKFEYELERDFQKAVNEYYEKHNELPNSQQLQRLVQQNYYGMLDNTADKECGKIETDKIVYNKLPIKNLAQLSYSIYQDDSLIESEDKANECLKYLKENLQKVYDLIEMLDDEEYFEDEKKEVPKKRNEVDLYQIGDIINFIETIKIKKV